MSRLSEWLSETSRISRFERDVFAMVAAETSAFGHGSTTFSNMNDVVKRVVGIPLSKMDAKTRSRVSESAARAVACTLSASDRPDLFEKHLRKKGYDADAAHALLESGGKNKFRMFGDFVGKRFASGVRFGLKKAKIVASEVINNAKNIVAKTSPVVLAAVLLVSSPSVAGDVSKYIQPEEISALEAFADHVGECAFDRGESYGETMFDITEERIGEGASLDADPFSVLDDFVLSPESPVKYSIEENDDGIFSITLEFENGVVHSGKSHDGEALKLSVAEHILESHGVPPNFVLSRYLAKFVLKDEGEIVPSEIIAKAVDNHQRWAESLNPQIMEKIAMSEAIRRVFLEYMKGHKRKLDNMEEKAWEFAGLTMKYSGITGIPPSVLAALVTAESSVDPRANQKYGAGLFQVNPTVHLSEKGMARKLGIKDVETLMIPENNYLLGSKILLGQYQRATKKDVPEFEDFMNPEIRRKALHGYSGGARETYHKNIEREIARIEKYSKDIAKNEMSKSESAFGKKLPAFQERDSRGHKIVEKSVTDFANTFDELGFDPNISDNIAVSLVAQSLLVGRNTGVPAEEIVSGGISIVEQGIQSLGMQRC